MSWYITPKTFEKGRALGPESEEQKQDRLKKEKIKKEQNENLKVIRAQEDIISKEQKRKKQEEEYDFFEKNLIKRLERIERRNKDNKTLYFIFHIGFGYLSFNPNAISEKECYVEKAFPCYSLFFESKEKAESFLKKLKSKQIFHEKDLFEIKQKTTHELMNITALKWAMDKTDGDKVSERIKKDYYRGVLFLITDTKSNKTYKAKEFEILYSGHISFVELNKYRKIFKDFTVDETYIDEVTKQLSEHSKALANQVIENRLFKERTEMHKYMDSF